MVKAVTLIAVVIVKTEPMYVSVCMITLVAVVAANVGLSGYGYCAGNGGKRVNVRFSVWITLVAVVKLVTQPLWGLVCMVAGD